MIPENRHANCARISTKQFRQFVRYLALNLKASQMALLAVLNRNTVNRYVQAIRVRGVYGKTIVFGLFQRNGQVYTELVPDCRKVTLQAIIKTWQKTTSVRAWLNAILTGSLRACSPQYKSNLPFQVPRV